MLPCSALGVVLGAENEAALGRERVLLHRRQRAPRPGERHAVLTGRHHLDARRIGKGQRGGGRIV